jgi:hypothetical protein
MSLPAKKREIAISANANLNLLLNHYLSMDADGTITIRDYEKFIGQLDDMVGGNEATEQMMNQFQTILQMAIDADKTPTGFQG